MNVLSLFDGIACGRVALERAGINVDKYYASEINKESIRVAMKNYPDIIQVGDVTKLKGSDFKDIDLIIGGSPCVGLSRANIGGKGLEDNRSGLFYEFVRILREVKPRYFLLENVIMGKKWRDMITDLLGVPCIEINSCSVSAQNRVRLYWTNIPNVTQPVDRGILIKDIIYDDNYKVFTDERIERTKVFTKNYIKWDLSGKRYWSQQDRAYFKDGKSCTIPKNNPCNKVNIWLGENRYRRIHPIEAERLQTLPDNYTDCVKSVNERIGLIGDGWTVDVIAHILSFIPKG